MVATCDSCGAKIKKSAENIFQCRKCLKNNTMKYEYLIVKEQASKHCDDDTSMFNILGQDGWELISYNERYAKEEEGEDECEIYTAIFKRKL